MAENVPLELALLSSNSQGERFTSELIPPKTKFVMNMFNDCNETNKPSNNNSRGSKKPRKPKTAV
eukprot:747705-Hanusia_phi.AAC.9